MVSRENAAIEFLFLILRIPVACTDSHPLSLFLKELDHVRELVGVAIISYPSARIINSIFNT